MEKVHLVYHKITNTTWANCPDWHERWQTEVIEYGQIELEIDNVFEMKRKMESDGYIMVRNSPFKMLENPPPKFQ